MHLDYLNMLDFGTILYVNVKFREIPKVYYLCLEILEFIFCDLFLNEQLWRSEKMWDFDENIWKNKIIMLVLFDCAINLFEGF